MRERICESAAQVLDDISLARVLKLAEKQMRLDLEIAAQELADKAELEGTSPVELAQAAADVANMAADLVALAHAGRILAEAEAACGDEDEDEE